MRDDRGYRRERPQYAGQNREARQDRRGSGSRRYESALGDNPPRRANVRQEIPRAVRIDEDPAQALYTEQSREKPQRGPMEGEAAENLLVGRNPIREALRSGRSLEKLLVARGDLSGAAMDIVRMAREAGVIVQTVDRQRLDRIYPNHQGMLAYVSEAEYATVEDILNRARERGEDPFVILLDGVTDPHNLGAIIRSAECAGAHGVIIPERRSAGLGPAAVKASAGALNYLPVARVTNLNRTAEELKQAGLWITAAALEGEDVYRADLTGPIALVIGSEGDGISHMMLERADHRVTIPMPGHIQSLNASVAAGVLMFEVVRARRG